KTMTIRIFTLVGAGALTVGLMTACSSDEGEMVGGMTECTDKIVNGEAEEYISEMSDGANQWYPDSVQCSDGWAVAFGTLGDAGQSPDDAMGAPTNIIFQAEGQFWIPKDQADVCGTYEDGSYPSDAEIPKDLYEACLSG
ncbi:MAG: hypothetical protein VW937_06920, partial [Actinomycetota bacterium]